MIDEVKISEIIDEAVETLKKVIKVDKNKLVLNGIPDFGENYIKACMEFEDITIHSRGKHFPHKLFGKMAPNEDKKMHDYRKSIYKPVTKPDWRRGINNYNRVFNPQNFSITGWGNNENEFEKTPAEEYFMDDYPKEDSIVAYFRKYVKAAKLEDANGVLALWILNHDAVDTELREPIGKVFNCPNVLEYEDDYVLILCPDRVKVDYYGRQTEIGLVFWIYDDTNIYKVTQVGKFGDYEFEYEIWYKHELGYVPVRRLGGIPVNDHLFQSHAADAVPPLDEKLFDSSTLQASKIAHAYPIKYEFTDDCPNPDCKDGYVYLHIDGKEGLEQKTCRECGGDGRIAANPLGVHQIRRLTGMEEGGETPIPPVGFVNMDPTILEFLRSEITREEKQSFSFLGVDISGETASGTETATGRLIDRETLFSALMDFSNEIWDLLEFTLDFCGRVRYGNNFQMPTIKKPNTFSIRTDADITEEFSKANTDSYPDSLKNSLIMQYQAIRFGSDEQLKVIMELKQLIDRLYLMTNDDIIKQKAVGLVQNWEAVLHTSFDTIIGEKINENPQYLEKDWKVIKEEMISAAKALTPQLPKPQPDAST